jgi:hypothetical protein
MTQNSTVHPDTLGYAHRLLAPRAESTSDKRVWSVPLAGVWIPFFMATNAVGESDIAPDVLGAPIRLQKNEDGTPKFSKNGKPVLRTAKELSDQIRVVRENFTYGLVSFTENIRKAMPAEYKAQVNAAETAGAPLIKGDTECVAAYLEQVKAAEEAPAQPQEDRELVAA